MYHSRAAVHIGEEKQEVQIGTNVAWRSRVVYVPLVNPINLSPLSLAENPDGIPRPGGGRGVGGEG